jgi:hypothetical protein
MGGAEPDGSQWGLNIGGFIAARQGWLIRGGFDGYGWTAQRKDSRGWARGPVLASLSLDELDAKIAAAEASTAS